MIAQGDIERALSKLGGGCGDSQVGQGLETILARPVQNLKMFRLVFRMMIAIVTAIINTNKIYSRSVCPRADFSLMETS